MVLSGNIRLFTFSLLLNVARLIDFGFGVDMSTSKKSVSGRTSEPRDWEKQSSKGFSSHWELQVFQMPRLDWSIGLFTWKKTLQHNKVLTIWGGSIQFDAMNLTFTLFVIFGTPMMKPLPAITCRWILRYSRNYENESAHCSILRSVHDFAFNIAGEDKCKFVVQRASSGLLDCVPAFFFTKV